MTDSSTLDKIRSGDEKVLSKTYEAFRVEFIKWAQKNYGCSPDDAKEAYQVSFLIFYNNVLSGKLPEISSTIKTYLFAIGRNKIFEQNRHQARFLNKVKEDTLHDELFQTESQEKEEKYKRIENGLLQLGSPCREMLEMVYYQKRSMAYVAQQLGYKNETTAKNLKYKCMQRLKKIVEGIII